MAQGNYEAPKNSGSGYSFKRILPNLVFIAAGLVGLTFVGEYLHRAAAISSHKAHMEVETLLRDMDKLKETVKIQSEEFNKAREEDEREWQKELREFKPRLETSLRDGLREGLRQAFSEAELK